METSEVVRCLERLAQLDIDASRAYGRAVESIDSAALRAQLIGFRDEHERHVEELSAAIVRCGGEAPRRLPDATGLVIEGFTATAGALGTPGALWAMQMNEVLTNATYRAAAGLDLPAEVMPLVRRGAEDERRHLAEISEALAGLAVDIATAIPRRVLRTRSTGWAPALFSAAVGALDASLDIAASLLRPGVPSDRALQQDPAEPPPRRGSV